MILAEDLINEIASLDDAGLSGYNFTELFEFMRKESVVIQNLEKENRKLEMIIKEGLGPEDLKRDF